MTTPDAAFNPLPPELYSSYHEGPFELCSDCGASLAESQAPHIVGKSWRDGEVIFEFALCMTCALSLFSQYSEESKRNLEEYFRPLELSERAGLSACVRCGKAFTAPGEEKNVEAVVMGRMLIDEPIAVCGPCAEGAEGVLSKATREAFDDFVRRVCPTFPADADLPAPIFSLP